MIQEKAKNSVFASRGLIYNTVGSLSRMVEARQPVNEFLTNSRDDSDDEFL